MTRMLRSGNFHANDNETKLTSLPLAAYIYIYMRRVHIHVLLILHASIPDPKVLHVHLL